MKADSLKINKVFSSGGDIHYVLPHFQREYAWEKENWQLLVKDIFSIYDVYDDKKPPEHFMGALVVINDGTRNGTVPVFRLVDGQQRLTTISLFLHALGQLVRESDAKLYKRIQRVLINEDEPGLLYYKLLPTKKYSDQASYLAILKNRPVPVNVDSKIPLAYAYFQKDLHTRFQQGKFEPNQLFIVVMNCLQVVFIDLNQNERPYEIFESLNYKGKTLTQADLVRNYIAMKLPETHQTRVFEELWSPIEEMLQERRTVGRSRLGELTAFLRHYLAYHAGVLCNEEHVYSRFRDRGETLDTEGFIEEISVLKRFAEYYNRLLRPENEPDQEIREQLQRLHVLEVSTAYPFLLFAFDAKDKQEISRADFLEGLTLLENYFVRRVLVRESTNYLNKMFPTLARDVDTNQFGTTLRQAILTKNYPSDVRIRQAAEMAKLYSSSGRPRLTFILETINRQLSAGTGAYTQLDGDATIEHIMPQKPSDEWKQALGENLMQDYELLHTLGNLTLVTQEWNSTLSNAPYADKKAILQNHGLLLNKNYFQNGPDIWNGAMIRERAAYLAEQTLAIWPSLGDAPEPRGWQERPKSLTILGEIFEVKSWRDVAHQTAECVAQISDDFTAVTEDVSSYFSLEPFQGTCRQLSNGWWIYVNLSSDNVKRICDSLIDSAGIPEDEYDLEMW
ncbi:MAG: DUF262 domain-containing protein [Anaerolineales bacterium]|nr:DUF262 domain-containing protein [Anaerolineales bacterium]